MLWKRIEPSKVHRLFYPQIPVIVSVEFDGSIGGMPAIWCMPLSFEPPLVGVAVDRRHETYRMLRGSEAFGINWLSFPYAKKLAELGEISGREYGNKLQAVGLTVVKGAKTAQPLIEEASASLECRRLETHSTGTHGLVVAEVVDALADESFGDYWDYSKHDPVFYAGTVSEGGKGWLFMSKRGEMLKVPLTH